MSVKVSVITTVYNGEKYLQNCIDSVANQDMKSYEHIIVDDKSEDSSRQIISKNALNNSKIKPLFNLENRGQATSINLAILKAKGDFIAHLDCDDFMLPNRLSQQLKSFDKNPEISFVFSSSNH